MKVKVKSLQGVEYRVNVINDELVSTLKERINEQDQSLPPSRQKLVYKGKTMHDTSQLMEYLLEEDSKIHLIVQKDNTANTQMDQNIHSSTTTSSTTTHTRKPLPTEYETILKERLSQYLDEKTLETIMLNLQPESDHDIATIPIDDLELIAKQKLNITNQ